MKNQSAENDIDRADVGARVLRTSMFGRAAIALLCWGPMVDVYVNLVVLSDSHLQDPAWPVHAQFHLIWALITPVISGFALFYLVIRHWQRLPSTARAAICVVISGWYLGDALAYFVIAPLYLEGDAAPHAESYVLSPFFKTGFVVQALLASAVALAYYFDRKHNPAPVSSVGE
jgi:hypothetical protein